MGDVNGPVPSVGLDFIKRSEEPLLGRISSRPDTEFVYSRHPITVKGKAETRTCELQLDMLPKSSWWRWNEDERFRIHKNMRCGSDAEWKEHLSDLTSFGSQQEPLPQVEGRFYPSKAETKAVLDKHLKLE